MNKTVKRTSPKPVLHGFLLSNGTFVTPAEMKIMESLGIFRTTKTRS